MSETKIETVATEVYRNIYETWRFEVDSYWQRTNYFAAFETAAVAGCWYVLESAHHLVIGFVFTSLGLALTVVWAWSNAAVNRYIDYWWESAKKTEQALALGEHQLDFACKHPGSRLYPRAVTQLVPVLFGSAWVALVLYGVCQVCSCRKP